VPATVLSGYLAHRFAQQWCEEVGAVQSIGEMSDKGLRALAKALHDWQVKPCGTSGYGKAEVTLGGVDTDELSSKTMEAKKVPGLYFIGEVVDVTGWLGGYNFQWAWASGWAAGQVV
jgi:predicted Rossmann fold flavoprotein